MLHKFELKFQLAWGMWQLWVWNSFTYQKQKPWTKNMLFWFILHRSKLEWESPCYEIRSYWKHALWQKNNSNQGASGNQFSNYHSEISPKAKFELERTLFIWWSDRAKIGENNSLLTCLIFKKEINEVWK